jgi:hypothetical protein
MEQVFIANFVIGCTRTVEWEGIILGQANLDQTAGEWTCAHRYMTTCMWMNNNECVDTWPCANGKIAKT